MRRSCNEPEHAAPGRESSRKYLSTAARSILPVTHWSATFRTPMMKYVVSPKHVVGTPRCSSYCSATRCPMLDCTDAATMSSRTLNDHRSGAAPGRFTICNSPSHVGQIQPFLEIFWTYPARYPVEYAYESVTAVHAMK